MDFSNVQAYLERLIEAGQTMAQLVVTQGYETVYSRNFGWADAAKTVPMTDRHLCWCFSNSKVYTAVCLMRLAEDGKVSLDDPVSKYLPEFAECRYRRGDEIVKSETPITLRHLISMTSGLTYNKENEYPHFTEACKRPGVTTREAVAALAQGLVLSFEPGTDFRYGLGHDVIGAVIEVASGMRFSDYMRRTIFEPLGIRDTDFRPDAEQQARFAVMCRYNDATHTFDPYEPKNEFAFSENYDSGGAGLFSRPKEYVKLLTALACGGTAENGYRVLKPETIRRMSENQLCEKALRTYRIADGNREIVHKRGCGYAMGVRTHMDPAVSGRKTSAGEFGWDGAAGAFSLVDREKKLAFCYVEHNRNYRAHHMTHFELLNLVCEALER
ncbi:MAG: beta-lactamase family protein [Oscillospiraceae bacterium]|nr:beta-lactamase family protein [Oscillospiraceae bacterium]